MPELSRRASKNFTPVLSFLVTAAALLSADVAYAQQGPAKGSADPSGRPAKQQEVKILEDHDTPPPFVMMEGSLIVELPKEDFDVKIENGGQNRKYRICRHVSVPRVDIAHIKVVDGSGEMLYRNLKAKGSKIIVSLDDGSTDVTLSDGQYFQVETDNSAKKLKKSSGENPLGGRKSRFRHKNNTGDGGESRIEKLVIKDPGGNTVFRIESDGSSTSPDLTELRVMVWLHGYDPAPVPGSSCP